MVMSAMYIIINAHLKIHCFQVHETILSNHQPLHFLLNTQDHTSISADLFPVDDCLEQRVYHQWHKRVVHFTPELNRVSWLYL